MPLVTLGGDLLQPMETLINLRPWMVGGIRVLLLGIAFTITATRGQLAITEIMFNASTNHGGVLGKSHSDYWELKNYGPNELDLAGYYFTDSQETRLIRFVGPNDPELKIGPGKCVIFV